MKKSTTKFNKSEIMKKAWVIFRTNKKFYSWSISLKKAWEEAKTLLKNTPKILKETAKAVLAEVKVKTRFNGEFSSFEMWIPKSVINGNKIAKWFIQKSNFYAITF